MGSASKEDIALVAHLFRRAGFGATYEALERSASIGYEETVEQLLYPENQPPLDEDLLMRFNLGWQTRAAIDQHRTYWLHRMINTRRPLEEKIALFWHSVLCTGEAKVMHHRQMGATVSLFRSCGLGSFRDLLVKTAQDAGMIYYLDNCMSHKGAINENWGRELLELFSMGVGNYTEGDVREASRAFTGWSGSPTPPPEPWGISERMDFLYDLTDHDDGDKGFLGHRASLNGEDAIDIICRQPATARFLARHLYNFFVADEPPAPQWVSTPPRDSEAINVLVTTYFQSQCDIRSVLRVLFNSDFFKKARFVKVKSPTEVVVGTARLAKEFAFPSPKLIDLVMEIGYMGQELYNPPSVEGWHTGKEWVDSGSLVQRVNFLSSQLGDPTKPGVQEIAQRLRSRGQFLGSQELVDECAEQLGAVGLSQETKRTLMEFAEQDGAIDTGTQGFTKRIAAMLALTVATKEYQFN